MQAHPNDEPPGDHPPLPLPELAWRYRADEIDAADLPMIAAEALVVGWDTPALCELAGLPRNAAPEDLHELFRQALSEAGIALPDPESAHRYALRRSATRLLEADDPLTDLVALADRGWWPEAAETPEERALVALFPPCGCCLEYTLPGDRQTWYADLRTAALALLSGPPIGPDHRPVP
jgi:hypothetical protein